MPLINTIIINTFIIYKNLENLIIIVVLIQVEI